MVMVRLPSSTWSSWTYSTLLDTTLPNFCTNLERREKREERREERGEGREERGERREERAERAES